MSFSTHLSDPSVQDRKRPFTETHAGKSDLTTSQIRRTKQAKAFKVLQTTAVISKSVATDLQKQNLKLTDDNRYLHSMLSSARSDNAQLLRDNATLATKITSLDRTNKKLHDELEQYKTQLESLNISSASVQPRIHPRTPLTLPGNRPSARF